MSSKRLNGQRRQNRVAALVERDGASCRYCGIDLDPTLKWTTIDELTPLVRGGTTDIANQVLACQTCNGAKGDRTLEEYEAMLDGRALHSYHLWRVELKRRERDGMCADRGVSMPSTSRGRRRRARLTMKLADAWPCGHSHPAAFCESCAGP